MTHTVTFIASEGGVLFGATTQAVEDGGDCTQVMALPWEGYLFSEWRGDYESRVALIAPSNVVADMTVVAVFARIRTEGAVNALFWLDTDSPPYPALQRSDVKAYDLAAGSGWQNTDGIPDAYSVVTEDTRHIRLMRTPAFSGTLDVLHTDFVTELTQASDGILGVAEAFHCYLRWGVLAVLLAQEGPANDKMRSEYARQRFEEGVAAANSLCDEAW